MLRRARQIRTVGGAAWRGGRLLLRAGMRAVGDQVAQYLPPRPTVIQFPVNDICNSRCVMCNIWKRKRDHEITPDELRQVLSDRLFRCVEQVGISGGEPTLRSDLGEIAQVLVESLPRLEKLHVITNAIQQRIVTERLLAVNEVARAAGKALTVSVSLDGVGEVHDEHRGKAGNFDAAVGVIDALREADVPVSIGCTLTAFNCYGADDVLRLCESKEIEHFEFRLGVEINRVYNEGFSLLNPLGPEQRFHLTLFFDKLAHDPRTAPGNRRFYESLVNQLAFDAPRTAGCDWRTRGVTLDTRGDISYCSVASPILGSALTQSAARVFRAGLPERRRIIRDHCDGCQHDLLGPPAPAALARQGIKTIGRPWRERRQRIERRALRQAQFAPGLLRPACSNRPGDWRHVLITSWYGTETAGDKAILGEVIHFLHSHAPGAKLTLTTLDRKVSEQTAREMPELTGVELIDMQAAGQRGAIAGFDAVVLGGGPLEEIEQNELLWRIFRSAGVHGAARVIFGCGVGPFKTQQTRSMVGAILRMATAGFFRDRESRALALTMGASEALDYACDPAIAYVQRWAQANAVERGGAGRRPRVAGLVRANSPEYSGNLSPGALDAGNRKTARQIAALLEATRDRHAAQITLLPMHCLWYGGDDRLFNREIAEQCGGERPHVERRYLPLDALLKQIQASDVTLAMRYHGHLFSMALGVPFVSIDYTGDAGKCAALVRRIGFERWRHRWGELDGGRAAADLHELITRREAVSEQLQRETARLVNGLHETYGRVFGIGSESGKATEGWCEAARAAA